jgi:hypothetical protein
VQLWCTVGFISIGLFAPTGTLMGDWTGGW